MSFTQNELRKQNFVLDLYDVGAFFKAKPKKKQISADKQYFL